MRRMFSEKQIKEMISAGAQSEIAGALEGDVSIGGDLSVAGDIEFTGDLEVGGDLSITGDLQAKTLSQSQPNWELEATPTLSASAITKGFPIKPPINRQIQRDKLPSTS